MILEREFSGLECVLVGEEELRGRVGRSCMLFRVLGFVGGFRELKVFSGGMLGILSYIEAGIFFRFVVVLFLIVGWIGYNEGLGLGS